MIEQHVEEEVQVGSVCPPAGGGPVQGVHQAGVGQELQQLHLPVFPVLPVLPVQPIPSRLSVLCLPPAVPGC